MFKTSATLALLLFLALLVFQLAGQQSFPRESEVGSVAAQYIGRFLVSADGAGEVIGYMPFMDGVGSDLFADKNNRSERTALFTVRSNRISFNRIPNGAINHFLLTPVTGPAIEFKVYLNLDPSQDYSDPASFSTGRHVGSVRLTRGMLTVTPVLLEYTANLDLTESNEFTFDGRTINFRALGRTVFCRIMGTSLPTNVAASVPLGGRLTHNGR
jgi:hypothetical protein